MNQNILCIMERRAGETGYEDQGFQHFFLFPSMDHIKKVDNYYDSGWDYPGNDSGQSCYYGGNMYQVDCYGRRILKYASTLTPEFIEVVAKSPSPFTDDTFRPVGIARKSGNWYIITAYYDSSSTLHCYLNKFSDDWQYISQVALDVATYEEHDGLMLLPNGNFMSGTGYGYLVEYAEDGTVVHANQIDSSQPVRGAAVMGNYVVTSQQNGSNVYICDWRSLKIIETLDLSSLLNNANNYWYGTFMLDKRLSIL